MSERKIQSPAPNVASLDGKIFLDKAESSLAVAAKTVANKPSPTTVDTGQIQANMNNLATTGGGVITLRNGTYLLSGNLVVPNNVTLQGETPGGVILDCQHQAFQILVQGTNSYQAGTISATNKSTAVTGVGTSWTASMIGQSICISGLWYEIVDVPTATSITLATPFELLSVSNYSYIIATPATNVTVSNLTLQNSINSNGAVNFINATSIVVSNVLVFDSTSGIKFLNVSVGNVAGCYISGCTTGLSFNNCNTWTIYNFETYANSSNMVMDRTYNVSIANFTNSTSGGVGIAITNSTNFGMYDFALLSPTGIGISLTSCSDIEIFGGNILASGSDGIKLITSNARISMHNLSLLSNTGYGINISDSTNSKNTVSSCFFSSNGSGTVNNLGTATINANSQT